MFRLYMLATQLVTMVTLASLAGVSIALANIIDELGPRLSIEATIVFPGSSEFLIAADRDNERNPPTYAVVVEIATERDVHETVPYANSHNISFLVTTGLHGGTTTLGDLRQGVNIRMRNLNYTIISENGHRAIFGGSILGLEVRDALWAVGKQTGMSLRETTAVIIHNVFYQGANEVPAEYTAPLLSIGPVVAAANATDYPGLTLIDGTDIINAVCQQHDAVNMMFPISLGAYRIAAQCIAGDAFSAFTADATCANSTVLFEGYSTQAVKAVPSHSTAFPFGGDNILITPVVSYAVNGTLDANAIACRESFRQALHEADGCRGMHAYVNYTHSDETLEEVYGYESWRVARLKALKKKYDLLGIPDFYAPI